MILCMKCTYEIWNLLSGNCTDVYVLSCKNTKTLEILNCQEVANLKHKLQMIKLNWLYRCKLKPKYRKEEEEKYPEQNFIFEMYQRCTFNYSKGNTSAEIWDWISNLKNAPNMKSDSGFLTPGKCAMA